MGQYLMNLCENSVAWLRFWLTSQRADCVDPRRVTAGIEWLQNSKRLALRVWQTDRQADKYDEWFANALFRKLLVFRHTRNLKRTQLLLQTASRDAKKTKFKYSWPIALENSNSPVVQVSA